MKQVQKAERMNTEKAKNLKHNYKSSVISCPNLIQSFSKNGGLPSGKQKIIKEVQTPNQTPNKKGDIYNQAFLRKHATRHTYNETKKVGLALDINDLLNVRSNAQFIDQLSCELNRGNQKFNGTAKAFGSAK